MAVTNSLAVKGARGSIDNLTFRDGGNGQTIISKKASTVFNPQTPSQQAQRNKHRTTVQYAKEMTLFLRTSYKATQKAGKCKRSGYSQFISDNIKHVGPGNSMDLKNVLFSKGNLELVSITNLDPSTGTAGATPNSTIIDVRHDATNSSMNSNPNDTAEFVATSLVTGRFSSFGTINTRADGRVARDFRNPKTGDTIQVSLLLRNPVTGEVSNSQVVCLLDSTGNVTPLI